MKMRHNKFTLVELLVVICIASLLMGLVLPAFNRMVTGSAVDRLASNLKVRIARAQSEAVASQRDVALILPQGPFSISNSNASKFGKITENDWKKACLGGTRMCYVTTNDYAGTFVSWVPDETWSMPERGAALIYAGNDSSEIASSGNAQPFGNNETKPQESSSIVKNVAEAGEKALKDINEQENCAIIFSPKGSIRSTRDVYLVVAEAVKNGSSLLFPGGAAYNFRALKIKRLNGNVEYFR